MNNNNISLSDIMNFSTQNHNMNQQRQFPNVSNIPLQRTRCTARKRVVIPIEFRCYRSSSMNNHNNSVENEFKPLPTKNNPRSLLCKKRVRPIEEDNNDICMICNWKFPSTMIADEKNLHINLCLEGKGEQHRMDYMKSQEVQDMNNTEMKYHGKTNVCPFCLKEFRPNIIERHKKTCVQRYTI